MTTKNTSNSLKPSRPSGLLEQYNHTTVENQWRSVWEKDGIDVASIDKAPKPFYNLMMFPYPSAEGLHVGNMYAFTGSDIYGRFKRMQGYEVFEPIGLDGFGIHSENYALKVGRHPMDHAQITQKNFYNQLHKIGAMYDWSRTVETYDSDYYRWTQWIFVQMFKHRLAYRAKSEVNWCPDCKTVLADEQVIRKRSAEVGAHFAAHPSPRKDSGQAKSVYPELLSEGLESVHLPALAEKGEIDVCERCGNTVIKKLLEQWFFRITAYAEKLLENIPKLNWSEKVLIAQRNWIGKSKGLSIDFPVEGLDKPITIWTKFWETVYGTTFLVLAPEHPFVASLINSKFKVQSSKLKEIEKYVKLALSKTDQQRKIEAKDKTGVFTGVYAINPVNNKKIPIWVADYVLMGVGTGAVMGVPAHDKRDYDFAKKYHLDIVPVVVPEREYTDKNAKDYYHRRSQLHHDLLVNLVKDAHKARKKLMVTGGWAVFLQTGSEFRDFEDLDLVILESDLEWWREKFSSLGFEMSNMFPEGKNPEFYFQATKKDIHVDISVIRIDKNGGVLWLETEKPKNLGTLFQYLFEEKKLQDIPVLALSKEFLHRWKTDKAEDKLRWKEKADFLFLGYNSYEGPGSLINSGEFDGLQAWGEGKEKMAKWMIKEGFASWKTTYHLRDWLISRQRYWGPPIPMIFCEACAREGRSWFTTKQDAGSSAHFEMSGEAAPRSGDRTAREMGRATSASNWAVGWYPIQEDQLPVILPRIDDYKPGDDGVAPLKKHKEFYETTCPGCGAKAVRETDVSDTFLDSSWYFLRYPSVRANPKSQILNPKQIQNPNIQNSKQNSELELPWDPAITKKWLPVSMYTGGAEHSVLHLMYSRFVWMCLRDWGYLDFSAKGGPASGWDEPFPNFYAHGLIVKDGAKMSKSKGNVVNPDDYIKLYGADSLRLYLMFTGPYDQGGNFRDSAMEGMARWVRRVWRMALSVIDKQSNQSSATVEKALHTAIKKVGEDIEKRRYNTAIAAMMTFTNVLADNDNQISLSDFQKFLLILAPFAPYITEELWSRVARSRSARQKTSFSIHLQPWPTYDASKLTEDSVQIIVQVNGKLRETFSMEKGRAIVKEEVEARAKANQKISKYINGQNVRKVIFVPGRLINFVTNYTKKTQV